MQGDRNSQTPKMKHHKYNFKCVNGLSIPTSLHSTVLIPDNNDFVGELDTVESIQSPQIDKLTVI